MRASLFIKSLMLPAGLANNMGTHSRGVQLAESGKQPWLKFKGQQVGNRSHMLDTHFLEIVKI